MAQQIDIVVEPKAKDQVGWFVTLFNWNADETDMVIRRLKLVSTAGGKFTLRSVAKLPPDTYGLILHCIGSGRETSATVKGTPPVVYPFGKSWPLKVKVPPQFTQAFDEFYFDIGDDQ